MRQTPECRSSRSGVLRAIAFAGVIACAAPVARAQAPSCAWGDGVTLPISGDLGLLLASDGGAGVLAFTWPWESASPGVLRMFHVLEQGVLDPTLPSGGTPVLSSEDFDGRNQLYALRAVPDGSGGIYLLTNVCDALTPHVRCWELSQIRLQHVTAQGAPAPGWPALGYGIPYLRHPYPLETVDIVPDGTGGVIAAWLDGTVFNGTAPLMAQRFAADGTTLWAGGLSGLNVLTSTFAHVTLRIAGDGAGGIVAVASRLVSATSTRTELVACKVDPSGALSWGTSGKPVLLQQPTYSAAIEGVSVDAQGRSFVSAIQSPVSTGSAQFFTQSLTALGSRAWGTSGVAIGPCGGGTSAQLFLPTGFASLHADLSGVLKLQIQDETSAPLLGPDPDGMAMDWASPWASQFPLVTEEGHLIMLWANGSTPDPPDARALELDEWANLAPGWPPTGMQVCGGIGGHEFGSAFVAAGALFVGFSTNGFYGTMPRVQRLTRAVLAVDPVLPARSLELSPAPNPARGAWLARVALREASAVSLEAFDIAGRRVLSADLGVLPAGRHALEVPGAVALVPGVYRIRARAGVNTAEKVLVKVR